MHCCRIMVEKVRRDVSYQVVLSFCNCLFLKHQLYLYDSVPVGMHVRGTHWRWKHIQEKKQANISRDLPPNLPQELGREVILSPRQTLLLTSNKEFTG